jgi:AmmeMemoRadiSam system protein B
MTVDRRVRPPAAAGSFYPSDPRELEDTVDRLLEGSSGCLDARPWGLVVPHAGYRYSGRVAATAYGALRPWASSLRTILLLGPAHFVPLEGCAVPAADVWRTPLGDIPIDGALRDAVAAAGCAIDDGPHEPEHALEVQLPFLQRLVGEDLGVLPVAVGLAEPAQVAAVLEAVTADLVVISTDLSHYLDRVSARIADRRTADAVLARDPDSIGPRDACGVFALRGAVGYAGAAGLTFRLLDLRTSGDTEGDPARVVGYGAFAVER